MLRVMCCAVAACVLSHHHVPAREELWDDLLQHHPQRDVTCVVSVRTPCVLYARVIPLVAKATSYRPRAVETGNAMSLIPHSVVLVASYTVVCVGSVACLVSCTVHVVCLCPTQ